MSGLISSYNSNVSVKHRSIHVKKACHIQSDGNPYREVAGEVDGMRKLFLIRHFRDFYLVILTKLSLIQNRQNGESFHKMKNSNVNNFVTQKKKPNSKNCLIKFTDVVLRILLLIIFIQLERTPAFKRIIHPEEVWLYKNPITADYVPASILLPATFIIPFSIILINYVLKRDRYDFTQGNNVITLAIGLNGVVTSLLKITVGRPRPDFYYRCYPDGGVDNFDMECTGIERVINEGRKSFPSGHSSFAFTGFGFVFFYLASKLHIFNGRGRGQTWRLCLVLSPLLIAMLIAISRTCDYHHHWQDVTVGSLIGFFVTYLCFRQYYPSIFDSNSHKPYYSIINQPILKTDNSLHSSKVDNNSGDCESESCCENRPLIDNEKDSKWI